MKLKAFTAGFGLAILLLLTAGAQAQLTVNTLPLTGLNEPAGLAKDTAGNLYLADSANNRIIRIDGTYLTQSVLAGTGTPGNQDGPGVSATFNNPQGILMASTNVLIVADYGNHLIRSVRLSDGYVSTLAGQTNAGPPLNATGTNATFRYPSGLTQDALGNVYIADWGNSAIRVLNLHDPAVGITNLLLTGAALNRPWSVAFAGTNQLWVADSGNTSQSDNTIRLFTLATPTSATLTSFIGGNSVHVAGGFRNSAAGGTNVLFDNPHGVLWVDGTGLLICDSANNCIRLATNNPLYGATTYSVTTFAGGPQAPGTSDGPAATATFTAPNTLILNNSQSFYLSDSAGGLANPLRSIQNGIQDYTPEPTPVLGYVIVQMDPLTGSAEAVLKTDLPQTFYNDPVIAIADNSGLTIHFTHGSETTNFADPTQAATWSSVTAYDTSDASPANVPASIIQTNDLTPYLLIKAIAVAPPSSTRPPSAVAFGEFIFQTATPENVAQDRLDPWHIQLSCITSNSTLYYTLDGSDPTTSPSRVAFNPGTAYLSIPTAYFTNGLATLKVVAERYGYNNSTNFTEVFNISNAVYDVTITPNSGYYPMGQWLRITSPGTNVFYTMDGSDPTTNSIPVSNIVGNIGYIPWFNTTNDLSSLRVKAFVNITNSTVTASGQPVPAATIGIPPDFNSNLYAGIGSTVVIPVVCNLAAGQQIQSYQFDLEIAPLNNSNTPVLLPLSIVPTNDFVPLATAAQTGFVVSNTVEAYSVGTTNGLTIFAVGADSHILFQGHAVVALLEMQIPFAANQGDTYALNVLYPSATADGYATTVPLTALPAMTIMVTNIPYTVGDSAATARTWYNAGTFGDDNLDNADANQAFYAASGLRVPYPFSDVFNAMDAFPLDTLGSVGGDGQIRFLDWVTILERSLRRDPSNWARAWSFGGNLMDFTTNLVATHAQESLVATATPKSSQLWPWYRQVLLGATSVGNVAPNATVQVPVYAQLADGSSLAGLQFRALVTPQNGAPALASGPQFVTATGVANPMLTQSFKPGETAFGWALGSFDYVPRSSNFLGWITFTLPTNALAGQTYQVSLLNADGAPNATNEYDFETRSATVAVQTVAPPATICSDEWKTYFFGSPTNPAAADNADPDGDGMPNWMEFLAGTNPTSASSKLQLAGVLTTVGKGQAQMQLSWLTAPGRAYEVQWNANLNHPGAWTTLTTLSGTGATTNCPDPGFSTTARFYRLHVLP